MIHTNEDLLKDLKIIKYKDIDGKIRQRLENPFSENVMLRETIRLNTRRSSEIYAKDAAEKAAIKYAKSKMVKGKMAVYVGSIVDEVRTHQPSTREKKLRRFK